MVEFDWRRAIDTKLEEAGGKLPWQDLKKHVVSFYFERNTTSCCEEQLAGLFAMAAIPSAYLSRRDKFVRLPTYRMKYHARKFLRHRNPAALLAKYADANNFESRHELLRHMYHVCGWVAKLPQDVAVSGPVDVLINLLQQRGHGPLTPRLKASLCLVETRIDNILDSSDALCFKARYCWEALRQKLPSRRRKYRELDSDRITRGKRATQEANSGKALESPPQQQELKELIMRQCEFHNMTDQAKHAKYLLSQAHVAFTSHCTFALCQLLLTAVAWLASPRASTRNSTDVVMTADAKQRLREKVQTNVRKAVLVCLRGVLGDIEAEQSTIVKASVAHLRSLVEGVDLSQVMSGKLWSGIDLLLHIYGNPHADGAQLVDTRLGAHSVQAVEPKSNRAPIHRAKVKDRAQITDIYEPGVRIKGLPCVAHFPEEPKELQCSHCSYTVFSSWYFVHPKSTHKAILIPNNGHASCRRQGHSNSHFRVVDASPYKYDCPNNVDYCEHGVLRHVCAPCGGLNICSHGRVRWNCPTCRVLIRRRCRTEKMALLHHMHK